MSQLYYPWKANTIPGPRSDFYREISSDNIKNVTRLGTGMINPAVSTVAETVTVVPIGFGFAPERTDVEWTARLKAGTKSFTGMQRGFLRGESQ